MKTPRRIKLPIEVSTILKCVEQLERRYPKRKFTLDGHLFGSIGEVIAAEALKLTLLPMSHPIHDAFDAMGNVQIKMVGTKSRRVAMYSLSERLVVLRLVDQRFAEVIYNGPGKVVWKNCGARAKNGQRSISVSKLKKLVSK